MESWLEETEFFFFFNKEILIHRCAKSQRPQLVPKKSANSKSIVKGWFGKLRSRVERIYQIFDKYQCFYFVEFLFLFLIVAVGDAKNFQPCRINPISHKKIIISITAILHVWCGSGSIRYITIPSWLTCIYIFGFK